MSDDDFDILEYARNHSLCIDYTTELPHIRETHARSCDILDKGVQDTYDEPITTTISKLTKERLALDKDAAVLLRTVISVPSVLASGALLKDKELRRTRALKQELPMLSTDNELDLLGFGSMAMPDLQRSKIPSEVVDEDNDEGWQWPEKYLTIATQVNEDTRVERLAIPRNALFLLQDTICNDYTHKDSEYMKITGLTNKSAPVVRHVTPPLLPLSPPTSPYIPSSPACRLPLPSGGDESTIQEAESIETEIMAADSLRRQGSDGSGSVLFGGEDPLRSHPMIDDFTTPVRKRRGEDLRLEEPLTPPMFWTSPFKKLKSVSFAKTLHEYIPEMAWWRNTDEDDGEDSVDINDYDDFFEQIRPLAEQAKRRMENEQLCGADTIARPHIPDLDFTPPVAPWSEYSQQRPGRRVTDQTELDSQMCFILRIKREDLRTASTWHGLSSLERELHWGILTDKITSLNLNEQLHGEGEVVKFLPRDSTTDIVASASLIWKPEGLRIFDQEDTVELTAQSIIGQTDVDILIRRRRLELEEEAEDAQSKRVAPCQQSATRKLEHLDEHNQRERNYTRVSSDVIQSPQKTTRTKPILPAVKNELMFGGFSAHSALQRFMESQGQPAKTAPDDCRSRGQDHEQHRPATGNFNLSVHPRETSSDQLKHTIQVPASPIPNESQAEEHHSALPAIPNDLPPCSIMLSSQFLQQRRFMKVIERLYPNLELIFRDYTLLHSCAEEADVILSPSTGLIFSTLQQVKQRALPGQRETSPLRTRMSMLALRYERLVVLVSEGLSREMVERGHSRPQDNRDAEALEQLEGHALRLQGDVLIKYARGGEEALAHALVLETIEYSLPHGSADIRDIKPSAEETTWEVFLRRAGLNPFAAQFVAAKLSPPFEMHVPVSQDGCDPFQDARMIRVLGLLAFLMMTEEQRVQHFQVIMGGSRILRRLSRLLDQGWISAAHGFAIQK